MLRSSQKEHSARQFTAIAYVQVDVHANIFILNRESIYTSIVVGCYIPEVRETRKTLVSGFRE